MKSKVSLEIGPLDTAIKGLIGNTPKARVGIIGTKGQEMHHGTNKTNAQVGLVQELGKKSGRPRIPQRSFIRMPLETHFAARRDKVIKKQDIEESIISGNFKPLMKKLGLVGEQVIDDAFETSGWGKWPKNAPLTLKIKMSKGNNHSNEPKPLIDTGQLRKSISSEVID